jgi:hypothetical protein
VREYSPSPHDNARRDVDLIPSDWHQNSAVPEIADGEVSTDRLNRVVRQRSTEVGNPPDL